MSRRLELDRRVRKLSEIGEIMVSMKNLALMETRKLTRLFDDQTKSVRSIETAAADFRSFYPANGASLNSQVSAILVIGSERGFCGDYNEELMAALPDDAGISRPLLAVGEKLCNRLSRLEQVIPLRGPIVAEEVSEILNELVPALDALRQPQASLELTVVHHRQDLNRIAVTKLLPPFAHLPIVKFRQPPLINLSPEKLFSELTEHYLFAGLYELFYASLLSESDARVRHLDGAIRRLDEKLDRLGRRSRALRQEEITEEIEVILLSAENLGRL